MLAGVGILLFKMLSPLMRKNSAIYKVPFKCIRNFLLVLYHEEDIMKNRSSREGKA
jgi:hypothetical protein